jgi:hypothetical protein
MANRCILEDLSNKISKERLELYTERLNVGSGSGYWCLQWGLFPVGGTALSDALLLGDASSRRIHLVPKGCTLVLLDGDFGSIGDLHNLNRGGGMLQSASFAEGRKLSK